MWSCDKWAQILCSPAQKSWEVIWQQAISLLPDFDHLAVSYTNSNYRCWSPSELLIWCTFELQDCSFKQTNYALYKEQGEKAKVMWCKIILGLQKCLNTFGNFLNRLQLVDQIWSKSWSVWFGDYEKCLGICLCNSPFQFVEIQLIRFSGK